MKYRRSKNSFRPAEFEEGFPRFCDSLGRLTIDYFRDVLATLSELGDPYPPTAPPRQRQAGPQAAYAEPSSATAQSAQPPRGPALVLEAEAGSIAVGVFLVENHFAHEVNATIVASPFIAPDGQQIYPAISFQPPIITLLPGAQVLVRMQVAFTADFAPDARYVGEVSIPQLRGTRIPIVLLCRPAASVGK